MYMYVYIQEKIKWEGEAISEGHLTATDVVVNVAVQITSHPC